jgi:hypothetical protein
MSSIYAQTLTEHAAEAPELIARFVAKTVRVDLPCRCEN